LFLFMLPAKIYEIFHIAIKKKRKVKKRLDKRYSLEHLEA
jgi:hypothetical protein